VKLVVRDDDKESIIRDRMKVYQEKTEPILDYYRKKPETKVVDFEAKRGVDDYPEIKKILKEALKI
jgi:adenylate kinase